MHWVSTASTEEDTTRAVRQAADRAAELLGAKRVDLVIVFASSAHEGSYAVIPALLRARFAGATVVGCSAAGTLAGGSEYENGASIVLSVAHLPDVEVCGFHIESADLADPEAWRRAVGSGALAAPALLLFADAFTSPGETLCTAVDAAYPHSAKVGGVASGGGRGTTALFADGLVHRSGLVGVALVGDVQMSALLAQGARMVGPTYTITQMERNQLLALDRTVATEVLVDAFEAFPSEDQGLFKRAPLLCVSSGDGQYVVRSILGMDRDKGALTVGFEGEVGQTVRFCVRDPDTATDDLKELLATDGAMHLEQVQGALLFACTGRGTHFFGLPDQDSTVTLQQTGTSSLAGFFCAGEIGPVHGHSHVHSFCSAIAVFRRGLWN